MNLPIPRRMRPPVLALALAGAAMVLAAGGCGQKGDLYLPDEARAARAPGAVHG